MCLPLSRFVLAVVVFAALASGVRADSPATSRQRDAAALAAEIDRHVGALWTLNSVRSASPAEDAEFLRRISLDVIGRIPSVPEVRAFLADRRADKRQRKIDELLDSPLYATHFTHVWRALLVPPTNNQQAQFFGSTMDAWLKNHFRDNTSYEKLVRELLTVQVAAGARNLRLPQSLPTEPSPLAFYQANEAKPENLAASTAKLFLGIKLECAQCHDHPFQRWTRQQFWELAAFYSGIQPQGQGPFAAVQELATKRDIEIPGTRKLVQARFLSGEEPRWKPGVTTRATLANWLTTAENPYFARAAANRFWSHFFGIGLIEPIDEPAEDNPPSHPELLDELAKQFAAHDFDQKFLIRGITASRAYQLSSAASDPGQDDPRLFARMAVRGLTGEQLFDSLAQATYFRDQPAVNPAGVFVPGTVRAEFLQKFSSQDKRTETQTSILQALALMNGRFISDVTDLVRGELLASVLEFPLLDSTEKKIETLYLATLSRQPRREERERLVAYVDKGGSNSDRRRALADVFWVLLNSSEFILNH